MFISISREKIYKSAMKGKEEKLLKKIKKEIKSEEDFLSSYEKILKYSKDNNYRTRNGSFDVKQSMGFYTQDEFLTEIANIVMEMILKDFELTKMYGIENKDGYLYVPLDVYNSVYNGLNEYGYPGSGRFIVQGFDWSYDKYNNYDYSFVLYMSV